jgi:hypothetical protein
VRDLSTRAAALQRSLETTQELSTLAASVYGAPAIAFDLFSPGLAAGQGNDPRTLHEDVLDALARLEAADASRADLYSTRRAAVAALQLPTAVPKGAEAELGER